MIRANAPLGPRSPVRASLSAMAQEGIDRSRAKRTNERTNARASAARYLVTERRAASTCLPGGVARFRAETSVHFAPLRPPCSHSVRFLLAITNNSAIRGPVPSLSLLPLVALCLPLIRSLSLPFCLPPFSLPAVLPSCPAQQNSLSVCPFVPIC